jgi:ABC-type multidrug transport system ATPase subunit
MTFGVRHVSVRFADVEALRDVTISVPVGEITSLVGGDGAGKSTVLRCLVGQVVPSSGEVDRPSKRSVGYMAATSGTWRELTVDENVAFVGRVFGLAPDELADRRTELLARAGLDDVGDRLAGDLSGGMRQKLGFVLAVLHRPSLLVLDEPSTGVDPVSRVELWRLITETAASGTAVVMATTYLDEAERTNTMYVLDRGRLLVSGPADDLTNHVPGWIETVEVADDPSRARRRGTAIRQWHADDAPGADVLERADVEDAVIACMLAAREPLGG